MSHPARPTVIAVNQTASPVVLTDLGQTVPASGTWTLSDFCYLYEIHASKSLYDAIDADQILLNDGTTTLTKAQSLQFATGVASAQNLQNGVTGPASSVATQVPKFGDTTGKALVASAIRINASNELDMQSAKIINLATPTAATDVASKGYVDSLINGLDPKQSVRAASTANVSSLSGPQTVGGVSLVAGDRVLLKDQSTGTQNGIWVVAAGAWSRAADMPDGSSAAGNFCYAEEGANADIGFICTNDVGNDVVGTDALTFTQFSSFQLATVAPLNVSKSTAAVGTSSRAAREDHKHDIDTAAPPATGVGTVASEGTATTLARSDHTHQSNTPPVDVTKAAAQIGTSGEPARADHKHDISTAAPGATGVGTTSAEGSSTSVARADHVHQANTPPVNVTKAAAQIGTSGEPARADHKHDISTAAPTVGIGAANSEGTSTSLARADHNHTLRESGGPTDLTIGAIADGEQIRRSGTTIVGGIGKRYPASATDPASPTPANGDRYYNTALNMEMFYDGSRSKWLSVEVGEIEFGRNGNTAAGNFYRGMDSIVMSSTTGRHAEYNGTVVSLAYTRSDSDAATFEVTANGTNVATLASTAVSGRSLSLNGNFNQGDILAVRNAAGGNTTSDVSGKVRVRWRV